MINSKQHFFWNSSLIVMLSLILITCVKKGPCEGEFNPSAHNFDSSTTFQDQIFFSENDTLTFVLIESLLQTADTMKADINMGGGDDCKVGMEYMLELRDTSNVQTAFIYIAFMRNVTALYDAEIEKKTKAFTFRSSVKYSDSDYFLETEIDKLQDLDSVFYETKNDGFLSRISFRNGNIYQFIDSSGTKWTNATMVNR